jgi:O-antigen/teichoic acid export membrane protein
MTHNGMLDRDTMEVAKGAAIAFSLKVVAAAVAFALNVVLVRKLGAQHAGVYYLALSVVTVGGVFGRVGLDNTVVRFVASSSVMSDWGKIRRIYEHSTLIVIAASLSAMLFLLVLSRPISEGLLTNRGLTMPLRVMLLAIVPLALATLHSHLLRALRKVGASIFVLSVAPPLLTLVFVIIAVPRFGVTGAALAFVTGWFATWVLGRLLWRRASPRSSSDRQEKIYGSLLASSVPLLAVEVLQLVNSFGTTFFLGVWAPTSEVAVFEVAKRTALLMSFVLIAVNTIAAPKFAVLFEQKNLRQLTLVARRSSFLMTATAFPLLILFVVFAGPVMSVFDPEFAGSGVVLAILALGQFINVVTGSVGAILIMSGHERDLMAALLVSAVINICLNLFLVPIVGTIGGAIATASALAAQNLAAAVFLWKRLRIAVFPAPAL